MTITKKRAEPQRASRSHEDYLRPSALTMGLTPTSCRDHRPLCCRGADGKEALRLPRISQLEVFTFADLLGFLRDSASPITEVAADTGAQAACLPRGGRGSRRIYAVMKMGLPVQLTPSGQLCRCSCPLSSSVGDRQQQLEKGPALLRRLNGVLLQHWEDAAVEEDRLEGLAAPTRRALIVGGCLCFKVDTEEGAYATPGFLGIRVLRGEPRWPATRLHVCPSSKASEACMKPPGVNATKHADLKRHASHERSKTC
ncbi:hypothetical protein Efla_001995 [Eimeria flavescens]